MSQRNCLILGSGRSGTSMAAGILAQTGYFMGDDLWPADIGNPKGYFEDREVNTINDELIAVVKARQAFCFKDPRFSYTLSVWRHYIGDALLLCVFRDPGVTASSMVRECKRAEHMQGTEVDERWALKVWEAMYR